MKHLPLIASLLALVVSIFAVYQSYKKPQSTPSSTTSMPTQAVAGKIAFINTDSVLAKYEYFKLHKNKLEEKGKKLQKELETRAESFQGEVNAYQKNLSNLTIGQAKELEENLAKKQQNLQLYQQKLEQELAGEQVKMNTELYDKITAFLKKYGEEKQLEAVLKFDSGSDLLYGNAGIDITQDVIAGLNEAYKQQASATKK